MSADPVKEMVMRVASPTACGAKAVERALHIIACLDMEHRSFVYPTPHHFPPHNNGRLSKIRFFLGAEFKDVPVATLLYQAA